MKREEIEFVIRRHHEIAVQSGWNLCELPLAFLALGIIGSLLVGMILHSSLPQDLRRRQLRNQRYYGNGNKR